jgi:AcrR family transcriptional regulator
VTDERRLQEGQERIAAAALNLFLQNGYHNTSVREVAQKAGLSVGSVFNYFISKEEILFFLLSSGQVRAETGFQKQRAEFERLKQDGASPRALFLRAYERYAALTDELRRNTVLAYQETKSLTLAERKRFLEGEERIQHFFEEIIAYGISQGAFPAGDIRLKAHCLLVLAQSWAVRHWALSSFTKLDEYLEPLKSIALGILESDSQHTPALVAAQDDEEFVLSPELTS